MKIKRFEARSMREAMRMVREEQGPDAVILSNRRTSTGVEVVAATDYDAALMQQTVRHAEGVAPAHTPVVANEIQEIPSFPRKREPRPDFGMAPDGGGLDSRFRGNDKNKQEEIEHARIAEKAAQIRKRRGAAIAARKKEPAPAAAMPRRVAPQLAPLSAPQREAAQQTLASFGLDRNLVQEILQQLPIDIPGDRARFLPLALLARRIAVPETEHIMQGGIYALVGPTGAGKTTTLAKLAARYIAAHSAADVAIVSTDHYRIGAQEQLYTYGRLLGLPVHSAASAADLASTLKKLANKKLVLIDTAGMGPRDTKLASQFSAIAGAGAAIKPILVLAANCQAQDLDMAVRRFKAIAPQACVLTKLDETLRLGGALSVAIHHHLAVAYTTDGQRVPEDLALARPDKLVLSAVQLARAQTPQPAAKISNGALHAAV